MTRSDENGGAGGMQAMVYERYGPPEVLALREVAKPVPGAGEMLIRIMASVATPPDCAFRSGRPFVARFFTGLLRPRFRILGGSLAGVVEAVGDGVARFRPGDRVFGASDATGCYAQYVCLTEPAALATMPAEMTFDDAVALAEGFLMALPFLRDEARIRPGQRVLVNGASGSIGTVAAKAADLELLRDLVEAGRRRAFVDRRYPLAELAAAHRYVETGHKRGSVVIAIGDPSGPLAAALPTVFM